jgi:hypothetical protein
MGDCFLEWMIREGLSLSEKVIFVQRSKGWEGDHLPGKGTAKAKKYMEAHGIISTGFAMLPSVV